MPKSESKGCAKEEIWYLKSGCNNHMVKVKTWFFEFDAKFRESVKLGEGECETEHWKKGLHYN